MSIRNLFLLLVFCASAALADEAPDFLEPHEWPHTVQATVEMILPTLTEENKKKLKETPQKSLGLYYFGLGMWIRNNFGLWRGNKELLMDACQQECHPDNASSIIIEALWQRLQESP